MLVGQQLELEQRSDGLKIEHKKLKGEVQEVKDELNCVDAYVTVSQKACGDGSTDTSTGHTRPNSQLKYM